MKKKVKKSNSAGAKSVSDVDSQSIVVSGEDTISIKFTSEFSDLDICQELQASLSAFSKPTPIQAGCWPFAFAGRDVIGLAETGSGKTLAFALPCLERLRQEAAPKRKGQPSVLVLAPTRELAIQTAETFKHCGKQLGLHSICLYGGASRAAQTEKLRKRPYTVVVATPGRLLDLLQSDEIRLDAVKCLVLDEADRMLDQGFERDIAHIVKTIPIPRQTLMFSATWPQSVQQLAASYLHRPVTVQIGQRAGSSRELKSADNISHKVVVLSDEEKLQHLLRILKAEPPEHRIIIFVLYKKEVPYIERMLQQRGFNGVVGMQGNMSQSAREAALESFRQGTTPVLVATDVAARGLDIKDVKVIVNYTFPLTIEDFVHRCGRTGRAGAVGVAHTFFTVNEKSHSGELILVLTRAKQVVPPELLAFGTATKRKEHKVYGSHFKDVDMTQKGTKITFD